MHALSKIYRNGIILKNLMYEDTRVRKLSVNVLTCALLSLALCTEMAGAVSGKPKALETILPQCVYVYPRRQSVEETVNSNDRPRSAKAIISCPQEVSVRGIEPKTVRCLARIWCGTTKSERKDSCHFPWNRFKYIMVLIKMQLPLYSTSTWKPGSGRAPQTHTHTGKGINWFVLCSLPRRTARNTPCTTTTTTYESM